MNIQFVKKSSNSKVGTIPITNSSRDTCPPACPFIKNGCYADAGFHTRLNWEKVTNGERGDSFQIFLSKIEAIKEGALWRHNVSGDLAGSNDVIDTDKLEQLTQANTGKRGFTYTHYPLTDDNLAAIECANAGGFTVNISANSGAEAVRYAKSDTTAPIVCVLPIDAPNKQVIDGVTIVTCPATYKDDVTCKTCKLCSVSDRSVVVGFPAHGTQAKKAQMIATSTD